MFLITIEWVHTLVPTIIGVCTTREFADAYILAKMKEGSPGPLGVYIASPIETLDSSIKQLDLEAAHE